MKTIGLLGGMSWESTAVYYQLINQQVQGRLGGLHSAQIVLFSVDFQAIEGLQSQGNWVAAGQLLAEAALALERAGADGLVLCTNTMHKVVPALEAVIHIPVLHIADATAAAVKAQNLQTVGLLGTRFTMEQDFYRDRLVRHHGLKVLVPDEAGRAIVDRVIYEELCRGIIQPTSREAYQRIIADLQAQGAEGLIAGCTEIGLLMRPSDIDLPLLDTTAIHAAAAVNWALA